MRRAAVALVLLCACGQADTSAVTASHDRLTLAKDDGGNLAFVDRSSSPDVYLRATLHGAPAGSRLPVTCSWLEPGGAVAHQNAYTTLEITTEVWDTHCHHLFGPASAPGTWTVRLAVGGRDLVSHPFEVR